MAPFNIRKSKRLIKYFKLLHAHNLGKVQLRLFLHHPVTIQSQKWLLAVWTYRFIQQRRAISVTALGTWQRKWISGIVLFGSRHRSQFVSDGPVQPITPWSIWQDMKKLRFYIYISNKMKMPSLNAQVMFGPKTYTNVSCMSYTLL